MAYLEKHWPRSCAVEIKVGNNKLLPHQVSALDKVVAGVHSHKIADRGARNPYDGYVLKDADALIVRCKGRLCTLEVVNTGEIRKIRV